MLSDVGWLNVISIMGILIFGCSFGLYFMYQARKTNTKLLFYIGLGIFFNGLWYWGNFWESLSILITGNNFDNTYGISVPYELQAIMSFIWVGATTIIFNYVGAEIIIPKIKWYYSSFFIVIAILWELFLFLNPLGSISIYEPPPNTDLIDEDLIPGSPLFLLANLVIFSGILFITPGYLFKSIKSKGVIRKKYLFLTIGAFLIPFLGLLEGSGIGGAALFFVRVGFIVNFWFWYFGLREEPEIRIKLPSEKEVRVEESLFRLSKRPTQITEEEVTYHRERKICLVCKGKISGFNIFICPSCDALYCQNCAQALSNLENACWACNGPIDESKPVKPYKEEEEIELKKSKKPK